MAITVAAATENTFPELLIRNARLFADRPAIPAQGSRHLAELDLGPGSRTRSGALARTGGTRPQAGRQVRDHRQQPAAALLGDVCRQALGAVPVPLYADSVAEEMAYVLEHAEVTLAVVEDQEQVDKLLLISDRLPRLSHLIYDERRGCGPTTTAASRRSTRCSKLGRARLASGPAGAQMVGDASRRAGAAILP